uniref:FAD-binding FR-type domain-containing protein n=1 Tax=Ganoderma boninense TaxID=34458 RepID=A0A5K1K4S5_9APHY|nr:FAD-binding FR-type domain-containing protein [Ganoderma boninense]
MDVMGASVVDRKSASPNRVRHGTSETSAATIPSLSSTAHGHHSSLTTLAATEEEKAIPYGKGYEYIESVPPLGPKANRRRSSASTSGLGQLTPIESIPEPPPSAGTQGRLRSKSASQSHRALALAKLDGGDRPYPPSHRPRRSIDASPMTMPVGSPYDMGFVPPPANRASSGGRRATRKPVPALDSGDLPVSMSPSSSPTSTSPLSRGQSLASTVTMVSTLQPHPQPPASRSRDSPSPSPSPSPAQRLRPPSQAAPTRSRSREDLEAAGVELPTLDHKSSFGDRPVHYLIPDLPPPQRQ